MRIELGSANGGTIGILWAVAQQTSLRNLTISADSGFSGLDVGFPGGQFAEPIANPTPGGGGTVEDVEISGGRFGLRVSASQWLVRSVTVRNSTEACVSLPNEAWALTLLAVDVAGCPVGLSILPTPLQAAGMRWVLNTHGILSAHGMGCTQKGSKRTLNQKQCRGIMSSTRTIPPRPVPHHPKTTPPSPAHPDLHPFSVCHVNRLEFPGHW